MQVDEIRSTIQRAIEHERKTGRCRAALRELAAVNGMNPTAEDYDGALNSIRFYIEVVPDFLLQVAAEARSSGLATEIDTLISQIEAYWIEENDLIPDHLGLIGVLDDAYASLTLLQALSDLCRTSTGHSLISDDLHEANRAMRQFLGEPAASLIDQQVNIAVTQALAGLWMNQLMQSQFVMGHMPSTSFGGTNLDDYVNTQLGAMGIF